MPIRNRDLAWEGRLSTHGLLANPRCGYIKSLGRHPSYTPVIRIYNHANVFTGRLSISPSLVYANSCIHIRASRIYYKTRVLQYIITTRFNAEPYHGRFRLHTSSSNDDTGFTSMGTTHDWNHRHGRNGADVCQVSSRGRMEEVSECYSYADIT